MAVILSAPSYSFVQINEPERRAGCVDAFNLCLPVYAPSDLGFQILASITGDDKDWFEEEFDADGSTYKYTIWAKLCVGCAPIMETDEDKPNSFSWTGFWTRIEEGEGSNPDIWVGNFIFNLNANIFNELPSRTCFNICFHKVQQDVENDTTVTGVTLQPIACTDTCFVKIDDPCFTSKFIYQCNEDSFGFKYTDPLGAVNHSNTVRLPVFLRDMQLPSEEKSYRKSNGVRIKLWARIDEDYELKTDWIYKSWHKRLKVLLEHDTIRMDNPNDGPESLMYITCEEKYEINWPEEPYELATAKTRVKRSSAVHLTNSNCQ